MRRHLAAILLALLVGAIHAAPFAWQQLSPGYRGVPMIEAGDADFYLTFIGKSYEASAPVADPFQYEYQDAGNPFQFFLIEFLLGKIGKALDLPLGALHLGMQFFFPAALTLLLYFFALSLSGRIPIALLAAAAALLGNEFVRFSGILDTLRTFWFEGPYREFLTYSRPVNPQASALLFFGALWLLSSLYRKPALRIALGSGLAVGALVYIYLYFWAFAATVLGVIFLFALVARERELLRYSFFAGLAALAAMLPFLFLNLGVFLGETESALTTAILTHKVILEKMILVPLFLYSLLFLWGRFGANRRGAEWARYFFAKYRFVYLLLLAGVIVSNQQVITGRIIFVEHFHFFTNIPLFLLSMALLGGEILALFPRLLRGALTGLAVLMLAWFAFGVQMISYDAHKAEALRNQDLAPILEHLAQQEGAVVLTDKYLWTRITAYAPVYVYSAGGTDATFDVPRERLEHDHFVTLALRGVAPEDARAYLYEPENRKEVGMMLFVGTYWRDLCGSQGCFPDSVLEELVPKYQEFASRPLLENIHRYKADYLLWDRKRESSWRFAEIVVEPPIIESGDFRLYALKP
ncbi:MAG TPA: hypothetical protein VD967_02515 [Candidatus Paceibacterota bacterium]|nr:hypothetical protein [Candidatus Paceibacterota bacterium]